MDFEPSEPVPGPVDADWVAAQRKWARGWRRIVFPGVFLVWLAEVVGAVSDDSRGTAAIAGYAIVVAFAICYLSILPAGWHVPGRPFWVVYAVLVALFVAELPFARAGAFVMCIYIVVLTVARLGGRAAPAVVVLTVMAIVVPALVPSWHDSLNTSVNNGSAIAIPMIGLAMYGFFQVMKGNRALAEARSELARLAAENERSRIARDLHDLLGHSLTTITVKAALACRLGATDPARAPSRRSARSKYWPGARWPTCAPPSPTIAR